MKNKLWLLQIPLVILFSFMFWVIESGVNGDLHNKFLRETLFPRLRSVHGIFTNLKFQVRGHQVPKSKVVIVEVDSDSISQFGRWPWHRDITAALVQEIFNAGAKVVGLDIVFSEPDQRIPDNLAVLMRSKSMGDLIPQFETDLALERVIATNRDKLVMGWTTEHWCQPKYMAKEQCEIADKDVYAALAASFDKFGITPITHDGKPYVEDETPQIKVLEYLINMPEYTAAAAHSGFFQVFPDSDGYVRRTTLAMSGNGKFYPSLALKMAEIGLNDEIKIELDEHQKVKWMGFAKSNRQIPVSPLAVMDINFKGPSYWYQYVRANQLMLEGNEIQIQTREGEVATTTKTEVFKDAYVMLGISAVGVYDMRAFPFDSNTPGVEGHANILDNILAGDMLESSAANKMSAFWIYLLMIVGALVFAIITERLEAIPALLFFTVVIGAIGFFDFKILFNRNVNWNTGFLYIEMMIIFGFILAIKYVMEERNKKFIKGAFAKYVSPAIIESIMKDPSKLSVGGEKRDLTIVFSDIRSFTTFSEKMDAKQLATFLNDYLGRMTDIVFATEGTLDKYIGDAVMAFWGAPLDQPKHAINACRAAIKMMQELAIHVPRYKAEYGIDVAVGVGINSGPVNVGNMGSSTIFEYTVIGDHVNLASRMEGLTKTYGVTILTSRYTFDHIKAAGDEYPPHRVLDFVKVKGKKQAVEMIQVLEKEFPADGLKTFEEGRILYSQQKWDEATAKFQAANVILKPNAESNDYPCEMYLERCEEFKKNPPGADWDGSWVMTSK